MGGRSWQRCEASSLNPSCNNIHPHSLLPTCRGRCARLTSCAQVLPLEAVLAAIDEEGRQRAAMIGKVASALDSARARVALHVLGGTAGRSVAVVDCIDCVGRLGDMATPLLGDAAKEARSFAARPSEGSLPFHVHVAPQRMASTLNHARVDRVAPTAAATSDEDEEEEALVDADEGACESLLYENTPASAWAASWASPPRPVCTGTRGAISARAPNLGEAAYVLQVRHLHPASCILHPTSHFPLPT